MHRSINKRSSSSSWKCSEQVERLGTVKRIPLDCMHWLELDQWVQQLPRQAAFTIPFIQQREVEVQLHDYIVLDRHPKGQKASCRSRSNQNLIFQTPNNCTTLSLGSFGPSLLPPACPYIYPRRCRIWSPRQQTTTRAASQPAIADWSCDGEVSWSHEALLHLCSSSALLLPSPGRPRRGALLRVHRKCCCCALCSFCGSIIKIFSKW